jgi:putative ABC transport system permease protein
MAMNNWLNNFSYRINIGLGIFILVGILTLVITVITVSLNAAKAALSNPVKSLRSE